LNNGFLEEIQKEQTIEFLNLFPICITSTNTYFGHRYSGFL